MRYRPEIDGLRALAVVPVILFHAGFELFSGGYVGVDIFFVISGYLITTLLIADLDRGSFSLVDFYQRRARRILPALFLVILCCLPVAWVMLTPQAMEDFARSLVAAATFTSNILFWQQNGYFDSAAELKPLLHLWSLAVEEQYYILYPLLLMLIWRAGRWPLLVVLGVLAAASLAMASWGAYHSPKAAFYLLPTRGWELLLGAFCAFYLHRQVPARQSWHGLAGILGIAMILLSVFLYDASTPTPGLSILLPTLGAALIILFTRQGSVAGALLSHRAMVGIGLISYSAYLWHQPLLAFAKIQLGSVHLPMPYAAVLIVATFVLAVLSWRLVEQPFRNKRRFTTPRILWQSSLGLMVLVAVGSVALASQGNLYRYTSAQMRILGNHDLNNAYVWTAFKEARRQPFTDNDRQKVLIIGDSFGGDFLNVLQTASLLEEADFSTLLVSAGCGNLYLDPAEFTAFIDENKRQSCSINDRYEQAEAQALLQQADRVYLATNWRDWEARLLPRSLAGLQQEYGDKFQVIGPKYLQFDVGQLIQLDSEELPAYRAVPNPDKWAINSQLQASIGDDYVDVFALICPQQQCRLFDEQGELVFFDGHHLSPAGAVFVAGELDAAGVFRSSEVAEEEADVPLPVAPAQTPGEADAANELWLQDHSLGAL